MDHIPDSAETTRGAAFDIRQADGLREQPAQSPRPTFKPLFLTFRAMVVLVVFGSFWLSLRRQHPYTGHVSSWAIAVAVVLVAINVGWTMRVIENAGNRFSGPVARKWQAWKVIMVAAWFVGYVTTASHYHAGVGYPVWGWYPASGPLLVIGLVSAAAAAAFRYWALVCTSLAVAVIAAAAGLGGPAGSWLIIAIGLSASYVLIAALTAWRQRSTMVRA